MWPRASKFVLQQVKSCHGNVSSSTSAAVSSLPSAAVSSPPALAIHMVKLLRCKALAKIGPNGTEKMAQKECFEMIKIGQEQKHFKDLKY